MPYVTYAVGLARHTYIHTIQLHYMVEYSVAHLKSATIYPNNIAETTLLIELGPQQSMHDDLLSIQTVFT